MWRIALLFVLLSGPSLAEGTKGMQFIDGNYVLGDYDYFCTGSDGERHELGEIVCLASSTCQVWLAKCDMSLNNPMWRKVQDGCPVASWIERIHALQPVFNARPVYTAIANPKT